MIEKNSTTLEHSILNIPDETNYWLCRANGGFFFQDFKKNNFIAVGMDGITFEELNSNNVNIEDEKKRNEFVLNYYKSIFLNSEFHQNNLKKLNKIDPDRMKENVTSYKRKAGISATKVFNFIELMDIGDFVMVPGVGSDGFLIGIITSNAYTYTVDRLTIEVPKICDYELKRNVEWITIISRKQLPTNLSWALSAHQTLFNITEHAIDFNKLVGTSYIYKNVFYHQLLVGTDEPINSYQWFQLQKAIYDIAEDKSEEIFIKTKVQSKGLIEFLTNPLNWPLLIIGGSVLFGEVSTDFNKVKAKFKSPLLYYMPGAKKKREQEEQMLTLEIKKTEIELEELEEKRNLSTTMNNLEIENKKIDLQMKKEALKASEIENKLKVLQYFEKEEELKNKQIPKLDDKQRKALNDLEISSPNDEMIN